MKENVGISRIYPVSSPNKQAKNKKILSLEERRERINLMLQKIEFDDDKLSSSDAALAEWSPEAVELAQMVKVLGVIPDLCVEEYVLNFFGELNI